MTYLDWKGPERRVITLRHVAHRRWMHLGGRDGEDEGDADLFPALVRGADQVFAPGPAAVGQ